MKKISFTTKMMIASAVWIVVFSIFIGTMLTKARRAARQAYPKFKRELQEIIHETPATDTVKLDSL